MKIQAIQQPLPVRRSAGPALSPPPQTADQVELSLANPEARAALQQSFAILAAHQIQQVAASLTQLPACQLLFHGTAHAFARLEPRPNQRVDQDGRVEWSGTAIFAAMDPRVALHYTANRSPQFSTGVSLRQYCDPGQPLRLSLSGGKDREEALNQLYGDPAHPESCRGYIHLLDQSQFHHEPGLGCMEKITRTSSADLGQIVIDRRAALAEMEANGLIALHWSPAR